MGTSKCIVVSGRICLPGQLLDSWTGLDSSGQVWPCLDRSGQVWTGLTRSEQVWTGLDRLGQVPDSEFFVVFFQVVHVMDPYASFLQFGD